MMKRMRIWLFTAFILLLSGSMFGVGKVFQKLESSSPTTVEIPYNRLSTISFSGGKIIGKVIADYDDKIAKVDYDNTSFYITALKPLNIVVKMKTGETYYLNIVPKEGINDVNILLGEFENAVADNFDMQNQGIMDAKSASGLYNNVPYRQLVFYMVNYPTIYPQEYMIEKLSESPKEYKIYKNYSIKILKLRSYTSALHGGYVYVIINDKNETMTFDYSFIMPYFAADMKSMGYSEIECAAFLSKMLPPNTFTYAYIVYLK